MEPGTITRCKFRCHQVVKKLGWTRTGEPPRFVYEAEFVAVSDNSEDNKKFFDATPSGLLRVATYKEDVFEVGKAYYLDVFEA